MLLDSSNLIRPVSRMTAVLLRYPGICSQAPAWCRTFPPTRGSSQDFMNDREQQPAPVVPRPALPGRQAPSVSPASAVSQDEPGANRHATRLRATPTGSHSWRATACGCTLIRKARSFREYLAERATIRYVIEHDFPPPRLGIPILPSFKLQTLVIQIGESLAPIIKFFKVPEANDSNEEDHILSDLRRLARQARWCYGVRLCIKGRNPTGEQTTLRHAQSEASAAYGGNGGFRPDAEVGRCCHNSAGDYFPCSQRRWIDREAF